MTESQGSGTPASRPAGPSRVSESPVGAPPRWPDVSRADETALHRFLGGSPGAVFWRLLTVSLIVGAFMMWLDIRPSDVLRGLTDLINRIWGLGFDAIRVIFEYIFVGAAIVVPVWLVLRLLNMRSR